VTCGENVSNRMSLALGPLRGISTFLGPSITWGYYTNLDLVEVCVGVT
jgi:hypothetical protein